MTRVSVVTAVLDRAATIGRTLASVSAQSRVAELEHLVVDGGSTDGTLELVGRAAHAVRLVSRPDHGIYDAFNRGLSLARGEWVAYLNSDDAWTDEHVVAAILDLARGHPDADVIHGDVDMVDAAGRVRRTLRFVPRPGPDPYSDMAVTLPIFQPAAFVRRALLERLGGFDARYRIVGDYDLFLRAWRAGARFVHVPRVLTRMRDDGVSERRPWIRGLEVYAASRAHTGRLAAPAYELARYELMRALDDRAPRLGELVRAAKRLVRRGRAGPLADRAP